MLFYDKPGTLSEKLTYQTDISSEIILQIVLFLRKTQNDFVL